MTNYLTPDEVEHLHDREMRVGVDLPGVNRDKLGRFTTDKAGFAAMRKYVAAWRERTWAVEGSLGVGRGVGATTN